MVNRASTGVEGLDRVLGGGLLEARNYMIRGKPGTGKTLLGLSFLEEGVEQDGESLFIALGESIDDVREDTESIDINLEDVEFLDLTPSSEFFEEEKTYSVFESDEVEQSPITRSINRRVSELEPDRIFVDPITHFRYISRDQYQFRKNVLSFLRLLKDVEGILMFTSESTENTPDDDLKFMSDGVITMDYSDEGRTLEVEKFRGSEFRGGRHSVKIDDGGVSVYPILVPRRHGSGFEDSLLSSGLSSLDRILGGGVERGTVTMLTGPSGVGKTTLGSVFMKEAANRSHRSAIYMFEELTDTYFHRCENIDIPVNEMVEDGSLKVEEVEPLMTSPQEFAHEVRNDVEKRDTRVVMIDGVDGYRLSLLGGEENVTQKLHALCRYLRRMGVTVFLVNEVNNVTGEFVVSENDISYLADNIVMLSYLEVDSEMMKSVGVLKKRASDFERKLREFRITGDGVEVGEPLDGMTGVLTGTPETE